MSFLAGDRASELGRVFTRFLFCHTFGKHFWGKTLNSFMVKKSRNLIVFPVSNLQLYVSVSDLLGVDPTGGYLFRTTNQGAVTNNPFLGSEVANCLLTHLKTLGIHCGETMHSYCVAAQSRYLIWVWPLRILPDMSAGNHWKPLNINSKRGRLWVCTIIVLSPRLVSRLLLW